MMIYLRNENGRKLVIPAPIWLVKTALSLGGVGMRIAEKHMSEESKFYLQDIDFRELKKGMNVLKAYKGLHLVDIKAKDGTTVKIVI